jgi:hypothetical protein
MEDLSQSASFSTSEKYAPSNAGTKQLADNGDATFGNRALRL